VQGNLCALFRQKLKQCFWVSFFKAPELNDPEEFMASSMTCPLAMSVIVTLAPLITAPEGSLTIPTMLPVPMVVCEKEGRTKLTSTMIGGSTKPTIRASFWSHGSLGAPAYGGRPMRWTKSLNRGSEWRGSRAT